MTWKKTTTGAVIALCTFAVSSVGHADDQRDNREGEFGVYGGIHLFNDDNELGVGDDPDADSLDNDFTFGLRAAFGIASRIDLEGELAITPAESRESGADVTAFGMRAHALMHFADGRLRPFALLGIGASISSPEKEEEFGADTDFVPHAGVGLKYDVEDNWGVRFDARLDLPPSSASESVTADGEFLLGLYKNFGPAPKKVVGADSDGDRIADSEDACASEPEDMDDFEDSDGCPEDDNDQDGIPDASDQCHMNAEDKDGFKDDDGCAEDDNDADGILDRDDACPDQKEDFDGDQDEDGCPDIENDTDGDGIADAQDKCPADKETSNGFEDDDGCPDAVPDAVQKFSGTIEGIRFQLGSAKIRPSSFKVLNEAAQVFQEFPALRVEIQGHTDNTGSAERNTQLSQERAQSVVDYLVSKGIASDRLRAKGYGPSVPVGDNATKAGRDQNRRVEFKLVK